MSSSDRYCAGVAAGHGETARAAHLVLSEGGNAFDAAIAGFLTACVAEPVLASLGGGGFLVARTAEGNVEVFDFFTDTPLQRPRQADVDFHPVHANFGTVLQEFHIGMGAVATPGAVAGIYAVHEALGRMPMTALAEPARELAKRGIVMDPFQAYLLDVVGPIYRASASARALFCKTGESAEPLLAAGDLYHPVAYADFLEAMCDEGPALFYRGAVAGEIAAMDGATIGLHDLASYRVQRRRPLQSRIGAHEIYLNPPPAIGGAMIDYMLRALDNAGLEQKDFGGPCHLEALIATMDACNRARAESGIDTDPMQGAGRLRAASVHPPAYRGTTHISVADADGNMAALTVSNGEGCGHIVPGTGIMLNNMLGEEDLNAAGFFNWPQGVRLSSMMTPSVLASPDGSWTAFGSGGSNRIRSALTQVIANLCVFGKSVDEAVRHSRLHLEGGKLSLEPGLDVVAGQWPGDVHRWPDTNMFFGGAHVIHRTPEGRVTGAGDPRRDGIFLGLYSI